MAEDVAEIRQRVAAGEKQADVARAFDVCQPYVSQLVNRKRRPL